MNSIAYIEEKYGLDDDTLIVTHDSVRPFLTYRIIEENIKYGLQYGACDTVIPATDTIVNSEDGKVITSVPDRSKMYQGQTPQSFNMAGLKRTLESLTEEERAILTDACKAFVLRGKPVALVRGDVENMKITYPQDLRIAEALLGAERC